jgi:hypothetical protein
MKVNNFEYSIGNKKIGKDTLIFNIGSAKACPSMLKGLCTICNAGKTCYAFKAERLYKGCLPYRQRQAKYWLGNDSTTITLDIIQAIKKHKNIKYIRVNESGDFYTQACVTKLLEIAGNIPAIRFYTYTARKDLILKHSVDNLTLNGSGFMADNEFKAVKELQATDIKCAGDCRDCNLCKYKTGKIIVNKYH